MTAPPPFPAISAQVDGHALLLVTEAPARLALMLETIRATQESLRLFYYIFADDAVEERSLVLVAQYFFGHVDELI